ncbi:DUF1561 family protein, partial [Bartonella sp. F02]|uniref:DUF1561 family protein n=1 Tax=Bartonella sp. F02 TaxID=2967262 RepID=UPI0022A9545F
FCKDSVSSEKDAGYWDLSILGGREGPLRDRNGNFLRVTKYGANWGVPYTAKGEYLKRDTTNSPTSKFVLSDGIEKWNRYVYGNLEDSLAYCPAPGNKKGGMDVSSDRKEKLLLPPNFQLNDAWRRRLYEIATTTDKSYITAGVCGACLLHVYQMIAELQGTYPGDPFTEGGYFFNTAPNTSPLLSFRLRYPNLYRTIDDIPQLSGIPLNTTELDDGIAARLAYSTTQAMLPRFRWILSPLASTHSEIMNAIQGLVAASPGTIWVGLISYISRRGNTARHAITIIRGRSGVMVIPTNTRMDFTQFTELASETTNPDAIFLRLAQWRTTNITGLATVQLVSEDPNPLSVVMSQNNCTGEGSDRRGNRAFPRSSTFNQCSKGRCSIM